MKTTVDKDNTGLKEIYPFWLELGVDSSTRLIGLSGIWREDNSHVPSSWHTICEPRQFSQRRIMKALTTVCFREALGNYYNRQCMNIVMWILYKGYHSIYFWYFQRLTHKQFPEWQWVITVYTRAVQLFQDWGHFWTMVLIAAAAYEPCFSEVSCRMHEVMLPSNSIAARIIANFEMLDCLQRLCIPLQLFRAFCNILDWLGQL